METDAVVTPGRAAKALAILCLAGFWVLPFSPLVVIAAVKMTEGTAGWARKAAVVGAVWFVMYTTALAFLIACMTLQVPS